MPQFVFSMLQCEVEEYLENMLTYRHQVPQNCAGFSRLDSAAKHLSDKFKGHINPLSTSTYDKTFMTPSKIKIHFPASYNSKKQTRNPSPGLQRVSRSRSDPPTQTYCL